jgi:hypothetical protein
VRLKVVLLLALFLFSCQPKEEVKVPSQLLVTQISEKPLRGKILAGNFRIPFKCYPQGEKFVFPLTFAGFVSYRGNTLRLGSYKFTFPLGLCKILEHKLVFPDYRVERTPEGFLIKSSKGDIYSEVYTDQFWRVKRAQICDPSGCYEVRYTPKGVEIEGMGWKLFFEINPFPPETSESRPRYTPLKP